MYLPGGAVGAAEGGFVFDTPKVLSASEEYPVSDAKISGRMIAATCFRHISKIPNISGFWNVIVYAYVKRMSEFTFYVLVYGMVVRIWNCDLIFFFNFRFRKCVKETFPFLENRITSQHSERTTNLFSCLKSVIKGDKKVSWRIFSHYMPISQLLPKFVIYNIVKIG